MLNSVHKVVKLNAIIVLISILVIACEQEIASTNNGASTSSALTPTEAALPIQTEDIVSTNASTQESGVELEATLNIADAPILDGYLFAPSTEPNCQLPCWQGLRIGISTKDQVQAALGRVTNLGSSFDFDRDYHPLTRQTGLIEPVSQERILGFEWPNEEEGFDNFEIIAVMDANITALEGLHLFVGGDTFTPKDVLINLGKPSTLYIWTRRNISAEAVDVTSAYVYRDLGIVITITLGESLPIEQSNGKQYFTYCLDDPHFFSLSAIVEPFENIQTNELSMVQRSWITNGIADDIYPRLEEVSDLTLDELIRDISKSRTCIQIEYVEE